MEINEIIINLIFSFTLFMKCRKTKMHVLYFKLKLTCFDTDLYVNRMNVVLIMILNICNLNNCETLQKNISFTYIYMYLYIDISIYLYISLSLYIYIYIYLYIYIYISYTYVCVYTHIFMYMYMYIYT